MVVSHTWSLATMLLLACSYDAPLGQQLPRGAAPSVSAPPIQDSGTAPGVLQPSDDAAVPPASDAAAPAPEHDAGALPAASDGGCEPVSWQGACGLNTGIAGAARLRAGQSYTLRLHGAVTGAVIVEPITWSSTCAPSIGAAVTLAQGQGEATACITGTEDDQSLTFGVLSSADLYWTSTLAVEVCAGCP